MADTLGTPSSPTAPVPVTRPTWPSTPLGWWGIGLAAFAVFDFLFILPMITVAFRETVPFTDSGWMPAIGTAVTWIALVVNAIAVWLRKERAIMNIVALVLLGLFTAFVTLMVVGEGLGGA